MLPTLYGRLQTRVFLLVLVGGPITLAITPLLAVTGPLTDRYRATLVVLAAVALLGIGWELLYHLLMQWRWEKDWPTLFGLLTAVPEGLLVGWLATAGLLPGLPGPVPPAAFVGQFATVWVAVWLVANGPLRVPLFRSRYRGGRWV